LLLCAFDATTTAGSLESRDRVVDEPRVSTSGSRFERGVAPVGHPGRSPVGRRRRGRTTPDEEVGTR